MAGRRRPHRGGAGGHEPRAVVDSRAHRAWQLDAMGHTQREIAQELGVTQAAVSKILQRVGNQLALERRTDDERQRARLSQRHEFLYREAVRGYERSQHDRSTRRQRQVTAKDGTTASTIVEATVTTRDGDPRFLEQAGRAMERLADLNGWTHEPGRPRSATETDPTAARDRIAGQLDRLATAVDPKVVATSTE